MHQRRSGNSIIGIEREEKEIYTRGWMSSSESESDLPDDLSEEFSDSSSETSGQRQPKDIDQPWSYMFEPDEPVWVRAGSTWFYGIIVRPAPYQLAPSGKLKKASWIVDYDGDQQGRFAPLDGVMKPDTGHIRNLLRQKGLKPTQMATVYD
ncbi:hypothetical protein B0H21DRAFT_116963 [Amylocystis lapponica]|nr:hypothetical protein B0H21DRAFT_116963 [Amylocystis lapponica]